MTVLKLTRTVLYGDAVAACVPRLMLMEACLMKACLACMYICMYPQTNKPGGTLNECRMRLKR